MSLWNPRKPLNQPPHFGLVPPAQRSSAMTLQPQQRALSKRRSLRALKKRRAWAVGQS